MIFSELYSAYYNTIAAILSAAVDHPLEKGEIRSIVEMKAFGESILNIEPALQSERWQLIHSDGSTAIKHSPTIPMTSLEKRWLKAIYQDPRIRLFTDEVPELDGVKPLFDPEDICIFDKYADGDPYDDEEYIENFRLILSAIKNRQQLSIDTTNRNDRKNHVLIMPDYLEYSEKDDKFRLVGHGCKDGGVINLGRIIRCRLYDGCRELGESKLRPKRRQVEFELINQRNSLERVMLHFAHFEKEAERLDEDKYRVIVTYDKDDEAELLIRVLSFGPMLKVSAPEHFVNLIRERLSAQKACLQEK